MTNSRMQNAEGLDEYAASSCVIYSIDAQDFTVEASDNKGCGPRAFQIDWSTGTWTYRVWRRRFVRRRFPSPTILRDIGPAGAGIGQDMRDYLRVEDEGDLRKLKNTNDQAVWVDAEVFVAGVPAARLWWVLDPQQRKIFHQMDSSGVEPELRVRICEREHV